MMPRIFISYRRADTQAVAGRIYDRLQEAFGGSQHIFKDVDSIPYGVDFRSFIDQKIGQSTVLLVIIGPQWLTIPDQSGRPRLADPNDFVRLEIESALQRRMIVIPVLVEGAVAPPENYLPPSLRPLAYINAAIVRNDPDFHRDMDRLVAGINQSLGIPSKGVPRHQQKRQTLLPRLMLGLLFVALAAVIGLLIWNQFSDENGNQNGARPTTPSSLAQMTAEPSDNSQPEITLTPTKVPPPVILEIPSAVTSLAWSPAGTRLAVSSWMGSVHLWNPADKQQLTWWQGSGYGIVELRWWGSDVVAALNQDGTVQSWDANSGTQQSSIGAEGQLVGNLDNADWSSYDSSLVAGTSSNDPVRIWNMDTGQQVFNLGHENIYAVAYSPSGQQLATGGFGEHIVRVWDAMSGEETASLDGLSNTILALAWSPDNTTLACGVFGGSIWVWDVSRNTVINTLQMDISGDDAPETLAWSGDGTQLAAGSYSGLVQIFDPYSGQTLGLFRGHTQEVSALAWSPDGTQLASGSFDNTIRIWQSP